jgi:hypothetical protein
MQEARLPNHIASFVTCLIGFSCAAQEKPANFALTFLTSAQTGATPDASAIASIGRVLMLAMSR